MLIKSDPLNAHKKEKKDKVFSLPLPTLVEGENAEGKRFKEKTTLFYISHQGATFSISSPITLGAMLRLVVDLPHNLSEDRNLKLVIKGKVALVEELISHPLAQRVSVRFETKYFIREDGS